MTTQFHYLFIYLGLFYVLVVKYELITYEWFLFLWLLELTSSSSLQQDFLNLFKSPGSYGHGGFRYKRNAYRCQVHDHDLDLDVQRISSMCSKHAFFYGMNPKHMQAVEMMKSAMMGKLN